VRLLILSRQRTLYATRRLRETGRARGHEVQVLDPLACAPAVVGDALLLHHHGQAVPVPDCVIPRIGAILPDAGAAVVGHLEAMGAPVLNDGAAIARARDKLAALRCLASRHIEVPRTVLVPSTGAVDQGLEEIGGVPCVVKLVRGTQGVGVMLAESRLALDSLLDTLWALGQSVLLQELVDEARGRDVRVLVVGGVAVGAMRRMAGPDEWRANLHRGGTAESVDVRGYADLGERAAAAIGLDVAGVDVLETARGPLVLEVNASPGIQGLEQATGLDVAARIVELAEARARELLPTIPSASG